MISRIALTLLVFNLALAPASAQVEALCFPPTWAPPPMLSASAVLDEGTWIPPRYQPTLRDELQMTPSGLVAHVRAFAAPGEEAETTPDYSSRYRFPEVYLKRGMLLFDRDDGTTVRVGRVRGGGEGPITELDDDYTIFLQPQGAQLIMFDPGSNAVVRSAIVAAASPSPSDRADVAAAAELLHGQWIPPRLKPGLTVEARWINARGLNVHMHASEQPDHPGWPIYYGATMVFPAVYLSQGFLFVNGPDGAPVPVGRLLEQGDRLIPVLHEGYRVRMRTDGVDLLFSWPTGAGSS